MDGERLGAGKTDFVGGSWVLGVGAVAVQECTSVRTLEGVEVYIGSLGPVGGEGEWSNRVVTETESAEQWQWTYAAIG